MEKKNLFTILTVVILLFFIGIITYPIFYNSSESDDIVNNTTYDNTNKDMEEIDVLSNLDFFKILVEDTTSSGEPCYSKKIVTIRDTKIVDELHKMIASAEPYITDEARGYDTPTTAICYLDDNTMCSFFVVDSNLVVFSDSNANKTMYKLDDDYDMEKFLTTLYNTNVNSYSFSKFSSDGKYGVKYSNKNIISPKYDDIVIIDKYIDVFAATSDNITTFIDKYEENPFPNFESVELIPATGGGESIWYESALKYKSENKYGLISLDGMILLSEDYDDIRALNYVEGYLIISQNQKEKVIKLLPSGFEELTGDFDSIKILGADLDFTPKDSKYLTSDSTIIVGINNDVREQYIEIKN